MSAKIQVVLPAVSNDLVSQGLLQISKRLSELNPNHQVRGGLGGAYGYGQDFKNEVFEMFPFYWGDCTCGYDEKEYEFYKNLQNHSDDCYQHRVFEELLKRGWSKGKEFDCHAIPPEGSEYTEWVKARDKIYKKLCKEMQLEYPYGAAVHCTCEREKKDNAWHASNSHDDSCPSVRPNFKHYGSGLEIDFYKYIGRDMQLSDKVSNKKWNTILKECLNSLK